MLPMHLMHHPNTCTNEMASNTLCPLNLPHKKVHKVSRSYTQKGTQKDHSQIISYVYIRVGVSNITLLTFRC